MQPTAPLRYVYDADLSFEHSTCCYLRLLEVRLIFFPLGIFAHMLWKLSNG
jgi:hypothetical protein